MIHPDYQHPPLLGGALKGGMPRFKHVSNRGLTMFHNVRTGSSLSESHPGFRAYRGELLEAQPLSTNSDDSVFDNQILAQAILAGARIGEISCLTRYFPEASSLDFRRSCVYGLGVLKTSIEFRLAKSGVCRSRIFRFPARALKPAAAAAPGARR